MKIGKLTNADLDALVLERLGNRRDDVVMRPGVGIDCGAIQFGDGFAVLSTDPITAADKGAGALAVDICCNDVAAAGGEPVGLLLTVMAPPQAGKEDIARVMREAEARAAALNVEIIGGHTEVTDAVNRMLISATVIGRAKRLISAAGGRPGDALVMTGEAAREGTVILANDRPEMLDAHTVSEARALSTQLSVVRAGQIAAGTGAHAMHDITEGGVFGAAWEMAEASGCGVLVEQDAIPVLPVTRKVADAFALNVYRLISSGSMLIAAPDGEAMVRALAAEQIPATVIGRLTITEKQVRVNGKICPLDPPGADELYRAIRH